VTGILYNAGMVAGPWFEGQLAQRLYDIIRGLRQPSSMLTLVLLYLAAILAVQVSRAFKRFYVRRFANDTSRRMRHMLYNSLVGMSPEELRRENLGSVMTKAVSDVDTCVEGLRKFITEIFDTGVVMVAYLAMLFWYDWRLALLACAFTPAAYFIAGRLRTVVSACSSAYKKSAGRLNSSTLDRIGNAITYRIFGCEDNRDTAYEEKLTDYEHRAVRANIWENTMQPLYNIIAMCGAVIILYFGGKNMNGTGWTAWNIAAFTTFLACFAKLAAKASHAAKLFNSVQKAQVSWKRVKPLIREYTDNGSVTSPSSLPCGELDVRDLGIRRGTGPALLQKVSFAAHPGEIIGVTGAVASGKSSFARAFTGEIAYSGSISVGGREISSMSPEERSRTVSWLGHSPELMSGTLGENIRMGDPGDIGPVLAAVCLDREVAAMPDGENTNIGDGGVRLSGGQQARVALARTLYHARSVLILDDPFASVDRVTEQQILANLRLLSADRIVILISHRLYRFPELDRVLFLDAGSAVFSTHAALMNTSPAYRDLYARQTPAAAACAASDTAATATAATDAVATATDAAAPSSVQAAEEESSVRQDFGTDTAESSSGSAAGQTAGRNRRHAVRGVIASVTGKYLPLTAVMTAVILGAVVSALLAPLVLERVVNGLTAGSGVTLSMAFLYFGAIALADLCEAGQNVLITVYGQKVTHGLRSALCAKLKRLPAAFYTHAESGSVTSRFVNDVDTVDSLFTDGIIGMFADACSIVSIFVIIFAKSRGLGLLLSVVTPLLFLMTRVFQKRMLRAQTDNRAAIARVNNHIPETIRNISMIRILHKQKYMEELYDSYITDSYRAVDRSSFYDSVYSPIVLFTGSCVIGTMMAFAAAGGAYRDFFGISVGTAVAMIAYVNRIFSPLESLGMEIQNIQSAVAGVHRIDEFLQEPERSLPEAVSDATAAAATAAAATAATAAATAATAATAAAATATAAAPAVPGNGGGKKQPSAGETAVAFDHVSFRYREDRKVLDGLTFEVKEGESVTLTGRTGAGKSTVFRLLLGLYAPQEGSVTIKGMEADRIPDSCRRRLFGCVEQTFRRVEGNTADQISLFDPGISREAVRNAAALVGLDEVISALPQGYDTPAEKLQLSQGQYQLLSIARAVCAGPEILLLDEITANLDSDTELRVLQALEKASRGRTVISISHRLQESRLSSRTISIPARSA
jgi:ABC-type multidrug transport system fused ATPase/permease subunit